MKQGDTVRVCPEREPNNSATGVILLLSNNARSIAIGFGDKPSFMAPIRDGMFVHPAYGAVLLATRMDGSRLWTDCCSNTQLEILETTMKGEHRRP